jgi:aminocarboxymuconate-semialdehyde decarboxylase
MFFALAYPAGGAEARKELLRALDDEYCKGIMLNSNIDGRYPDEQDVRWVFDIATERDLPILIHPPLSTMGQDKLQQYHLLSILGRPTDVTLAALRMILSGLMEEYKNLKVVLSYGGAALTMLKSRIDFQCDLPEYRAQLAHDPILTKRPSEYIRCFYLDTTGMSKEGIMHLINVGGAERVILGTDFPPGTVPPKRYIQTINELPISDSAKEGILGGNAISLLGLKQDITV